MFVVDVVKFFKFCNAIYPAVVPCTAGVFYKIATTTAYNSAFPQIPSNLLIRPT